MAASALPNHNQLTASSTRGHAIFLLVKLAEFASAYGCALLDQSFNDSFFAAHLLHLSFYLRCLRLQLGQLTGNHFFMLLILCVGPEDCLQDWLEQLTMLVTHLLSVHLKLLVSLEEVCIRDGTSGAWTSWLHLGWQSLVILLGVTLRDNRLQLIQIQFLRLSQVWTILSV